MKLSIVVPVYNVEGYIVDCLNSLKINGLVSYEIIVVNDGSTDNSLNKIKEFMKANSYLNIKLINQANKGLSYSRNIGLRAATGDYVFFIDSDDWINSDLFSELVLRLDNKTDIYIANFVYAKEGGVFQDAGVKSFHETLDGTGLFFLKNYYLHNISSVVWRSIYRREFLLTCDLFFMENVLFEDVEWGPKLFFLAKKVAVFPKTIYYYRIRSGSIMNSGYNKKRFDDSILVSNSLLEFNTTVDDFSARGVVDKIIMHLVIKCFVLYKDSLNKNELGSLRSIVNTINSEDLKHLFFRWGILYSPRLLKFFLKRFFKSPKSF